MPKRRPLVELDADDEQLIAAFDEGKAKFRNGGYQSDNPHPWETDVWQAWREGFFYNA